MEPLIFCHNLLEKLCLEYLHLWLLTPTGWGQEDLHQGPWPLVQEQAAVQHSGPHQPGQPQRLWLRRNAHTQSGWVQPVWGSKEVKFMKGPACREMTPREVQELGATDLTLRLHLFGESKKRTHVFLSILPGALTELSNRLGGLTERQSFLTLSYDVQHPTLERNKGARISPPADPGRNYATYS